MRMPHRFADEINQLRNLGFAEALPIIDSRQSRDFVARLECGSMGMAVEFRAHEDKGNPYRVVSLVPHDLADPSCTSGCWSDVMRVLRSRMRSNDDD
jgi:hypothetical protein